MKSWILFFAVLFTFGSHSSFGSVSVMSVSSGVSHTCATSTDGKVKCWGGGGSAQLGLEKFENMGDEPGEMGPLLPFVNLGNEPVLSLSAGRRYTCAVLVSGITKCWGRGFGGEIGQGQTSQLGGNQGEMGEKLPKVNLGEEKATQVSAGSDSSCVLFESGRVKCWGNNSSGQLGLESREPRGDRHYGMGDVLPYLDLGKEKVIELVSGDFSHCAIFESRKVKCWGANTSGQLGLVGADARGDQPKEMGEKLPYLEFGTDEALVQMTAGSSHTCALFENGRVKCWGNNTFGQLGELVPEAGSEEGAAPSLTLKERPFVELGEGRVVQISTGNNHSCALFEEGNVKCWGLGGSGQLGMGSINNRGSGKDEMGENLPFLKFGDSTLSVKKISANSDSTCAIFTNELMKCWGRNNSGQLGTQDIENKGDKAQDLERLRYIQL